MTNIPDPQATPPTEFAAAPPAAPVAPDTAPVADAAPVAPPVDVDAPLAVAPTAAAALDEGTYESLRTPKSTAALALDGVWHQISPRYVVSQVLQNVVILVLILAAALVGGLVLHLNWVWIPAGILAFFTLATLIILPRQARAIGYQLRADDIVFRKGILWQRVIAVPYGRMQLVDITHGPLDRAFGIAKLKMVTAAATTGVEIPGLTQGAAEALRDTLIEVAETRRTGL